MKLKSKSIWISIIIITIITIILAYIHFIVNGAIWIDSVRSSDEIVYLHSNMTDTSFTANASSIASGTGLTGYTYNIEGENLYIIIYGTFVSKKTVIADFKINIQDDLHNIKYVNMKNPDGSMSLIYERS